MFTYICLGTNDLERSCRFYDAVMGTLGLSRCDVSGEPNWEGWAGWGTYEDEGRRQDALWVCQPFDKGPASVGNADFYAAYVRDPDGNKLAAVCRGFTASRL